MVPNVTFSSYRFVPLLPGARTAICSTSKGVASAKVWHQSLSGASTFLVPEPFLVSAESFLQNHRDRFSRLNVCPSSIKSASVRAGTDTRSVSGEASFDMPPSLREHEVFGAFWASPSLAFWYRRHIL
jgi:hypothetical protein